MVRDSTTSTELFMINLGFPGIDNISVTYYNYIGTALG